MTNLRERAPTPRRSCHATTLKRQLHGDSSEATTSKAKTLTWIAMPTNIEIDAISVSFLTNSELLNWFDYRHCRPVSLWQLHNHNRGQHDDYAQPLHWLYHLSQQNSRQHDRKHRLQATGHNCPGWFQMLQSRKVERERRQNRNHSEHSRKPHSVLE